MDAIDEIDRTILHALQQDGRISITELAQLVELTPPTVQRRVKILEETGVIRGYVALVNPLKLDLTVTAFILVETVAGCQLDELSSWLSSFPEVQEVHNLLGEWCFLVKVRTYSPQTLEDLLYRQIRYNPAVRRTHTTLATSSPYEITQLPLPPRA
ncbi:MAG: Lrp/AsnC family transcriptional regulator [Roseiflexaceae bacterium]|nr:Lrp/AsnC family transcriptional regulator [Roseiflexaceae bacterium]